MHRDEGHLARADEIEVVGRDRIRLVLRAGEEARAAERALLDHDGRNHRDETAEKEHQALLANAEAILAKLDIPYRVALACTGEIGLGQTKKHEVESWMPSRQAYSETHSCSTLGDFQARRSNIRVRMPDGTIKFAFTLNNTAIASPRILIPLLENHQQADGSIKLPKALVPYMNGREVLSPKG